MNDPLYMNDLQEEITKFLLVIKIILKIIYAKTLKILKRANESKPVSFDKYHGKKFLVEPTKRIINNSILGEY